jgi:UDP-GlcNAc:undecaprenyl-phosphate/decaprenyl-phosphate GlcNAc-1-phosphate transferase
MGMSVSVLNQYFPLLFCLVTLVICLFAEPLSKRLRVVDYPDGGRKGHTAPTPLIGGLAIMLPLALWCVTILLVEPDVATRLHLTILLCGLGVAVMGFMDDQAPVSPRSRFLLLVIFAVMAFILDPSLVSDKLLWAGDSFEMPAWAFCALIVVGQVGLVSAINMADGMNGLVLALYLVWFAALAFISGGVVQEASLLVCAMLIVTLLFNARGRLFLGDCGTFAVTFVLGLLVIAAHNSGWLSFDQMLLWFFIPIVDCLRLIWVRLVHGRSPFLGDKNHFHHRLMHRFGQTTAFVLYTFAVTAGVIAVTVWPEGNYITLAVLLVFYVGFLMRRPGRAVAAAEEPKRARKVVRLRDRAEKPPPQDRQSEL